MIKLLKLVHWKLVILKIKICHIVSNPNLCITEYQNKYINYTLYKQKSNRYTFSHRPQESGKWYTFENVRKVRRRNKDERRSEVTQCLIHSAVQRRARTHVFTEQLLSDNKITTLISWWCSVKLGRKAKMMEEIRVCMCRACACMCVPFAGYRKWKTDLVTSTEENKNQSSTAFTRWCQWSVS